LLTYQKQDINVGLVPSTLAILAPRARHYGSVTGISLFPFFTSVLVGWSGKPLKWSQNERGTRTHSAGVGTANMQKHWIFH